MIIQTWRAVDADTPAGAAEAEDRAFELLGHVDEFLAEHVTVNGYAQVARLSEWEQIAEPFQSGWCAQIVVTLTVTARLT